jgi:prophage regulatory protein
MMNNRIARVADVLIQRGVSRSAHYLDVQEGRFTRPVPLNGRARGWPMYEVETLNAARIAGKSEAEIKALVRKLEERRKSLAIGIEGVAA